MHEILQNHGYSVLSARDGSEALKIANQQQEPIHLLLTDAVMPGINGHELSKHLDSCGRR